MQRSRKKINVLSGKNAEKILSLAKESTLTLVQLDSVPNAQFFPLFSAQYSQLQRHERTAKFVSSQAVAWSHSGDTNLKEV